PGNVASHRGAEIIDVELCRLLRIRCLEVDVLDTECHGRSPLVGTQKLANVGEAVDGHVGAVVAIRNDPRLAISAHHPADAQTQKGPLVFAVEQLSAQTMDPILEQRPGNAICQAPMYDSLVGFDIQKGGIGPGVAESWELLADGVTWTFHLRSGQRFHNGD